GDEPPPADVPNALTRSVRTVPCRSTLTRARCPTSTAAIVTARRVDQAAWSPAPAPSGSISTTATITNAAHDATRWARHAIKGNSASNDRNTRWWVHAMGEIRLVVHPSTTMADTSAPARVADRNATAPSASTAV